MGSGDMKSEIVTVLPAGRLKFIDNLMREMHENFI